MAAPVLAVIERGYRGSVEVRYGDLLYVCQGLRGQLGGIDLVLRGSAVTFAVRGAQPHAALAALIAAGSRVWVDRADLDELGLDDASRLPHGLEVCDTDLISKHWIEYQEVWYL